MNSDLDGYLEAVKSYSSNTGVPGLDIFKPIPLEGVFTEPDLLQIQFRRRLLGEEPEGKYKSARKDTRSSGVLKPEAANSVLRNKTRLVILGDPGQGKSTLLRHFALALASNPNSKLPLLVELGRKPKGVFGNDTKYSWLKVSVPDAIYQTINDTVWHELISRLQEGNVHVLLDGYDELSHEDRSKVAELIDSLNPNPLVLTSRPTAYHSRSFLNMDVYQLQPLQLSQIKTLAKKVCATFASEFGMDTYQQPLEAVLNVAEGEGKYMASNPLLLSFMCLAKIERVRKGKPSVSQLHPTQLIKECIDTLIDWHRGEYKIDNRWSKDVSKKDVIRILSMLAMKTISGGINKFSKDDLKESKDQNLFCDYLVPAHFVIQEERAYSFPLETFREYFAAQAVVASLDPFAELKPYLHDEDWKQVILYLVGSLKTVDASPIILKLPKLVIWLLKGLTKVTGVITRIILALLQNYESTKSVAAAAEDSVKEYSPKVQDWFAGWLAPSLGSIEFVVTSILQNRCHFENILKRDLRLASNCLASAKDYPEKLAIQVIKELIFARRQELSRHAREAIPQLEFDDLQTLGLTQDQQSWRRRWFPEGLAAVVNKPTVRDLLFKLARHDDEWMRVAAIEALGVAATLFDIQRCLFEIIQDDRGFLPHYVAAQMLQTVTIAPEIRNDLLKLTHSENNNYVILAVLALQGSAANILVRNRLLTLAVGGDYNVRVRVEATHALRNSATDSIVRQRLLALTAVDVGWTTHAWTEEHSDGENELDSEVFSAAVEILQSIAAEPVVRDRLLELTRVQFILSSMQDNVTHALQNIATDPKVQERLLELVQEQGQSGWTAGEILQKVANQPDIRNRLLALTQEPYCNAMAVLALRDIASEPTVRDHLLKLTEHQSVGVMEAAREALEGAVADPTVRKHLFELARSGQNGGILRLAALKGLRRATVDTTMRDQMLELTWDENKNSVKEALSILQRCDKSIITPKLVKRIAKLARGSSVWREAQDALETLLQERERQQRR